ncbi:MAG: phosphatidate cytidylyltransferase [Gammaproteobacteria bacterium]
MLKQRIITAVILLFVLLAIVFYASSAYVFIFFSLVFGIGCYELQMLTARAGRLMAAIFAGLLALMFWQSISFIDAEIQYIQVIYGVFIWLAGLLFVLTYRSSGQRSLFRKFVLFLMGFSMLWVSMHAVVYILSVLDDGVWLLLYMLSLVAVADIGAYFSGKQFGKRKLAPQISPGKTWEGAIGGLLANLVWMSLIYQITDGWEIPMGLFYVSGISVSIISVCGDLFESILKREAGAKDSGTILPGHGGVLDRIDGMIAAVPFFTISLFMANLS